MEIEGLHEGIEKAKQEIAASEEQVVKLQQRVS